MLHSHGENDGIRCWVVDETVGGGVIELIFFLKFFFFLYVRTIGKERFDIIFTLLGVVGWSWVIGLQITVVGQLRVGLSNWADWNGPNSQWPKWASFRPGWEGSIWPESNWIGSNPVERVDGLGRIGLSLVDRGERVVWTGLKPRWTKLKVVDKIVVNRTGLNPLH